MLLTELISHLTDKDHPDDIECFELEEALKIM